MRKRVLFVANSLDNAYKFQQVLAGLGVEVAAGSTLRIGKLAAPGLAVDMVVFEARGSAMMSFGEIEALVESRACPLLVIVEESDVEMLRLSSSRAADFMVHGAGGPEIEARVRRLLGSEGASVPAEVLSVGDMVVNLATYQVTVAGDPVDFTYLEYALLSFLVQHPSRTFTRDSLLQSVWGFDYYGGSRTVDVHIRRIRAKLGPDLAQHIETVRGVGYLWK